MPARYDGFELLPHGAITTKEELIHFYFELLSHIAVVAAKEDLIYFALLADVDPNVLKIKYMKNC